MMDITKNINALHPVNRMIYAYTTPNDRSHDGWVKVGDTEVDSGELPKDAVADRVRQQTHTSDTETNLEWYGPAKFDDNLEPFRDHDLHKYLSGPKGIEQKPHTEWFRTSPLTAKGAYYEFRENHGVLVQLDGVQEYVLRDEQKDAVEKTLTYSQTHENGAYLWNAKPRFGKTLSVYDLMKKLDAVTVLVLTNRPAIADSWYKDYKKFVGPENGYYFVSRVEALLGRPNVFTRKQFHDRILCNNSDARCIEFVSLEDLKGSIHFGGQYRKLDEVAELIWDLVVIDEAHEGVATDKTDIALDRIKRRFTLNLSGTPFKMLANGQFPDEAIFNWTYADEQQKKRENAELGTDSPYFDLPKLNLFTYQMSVMMEEKADEGVIVDDERIQHYFDLNEFFDTNESGFFIHLEDVKRFLHALYEQTKYPFSTPELRDQLKHTFWLIGGKRKPTDSALAMKRLLEADDSPFKDYHVVFAVGSGDNEDENKKAINAVQAAIAKYDKTITLSVGQLTTGVTIPEWTAVLMLCSMKSPSLYMQAAFRAQNPCFFMDKDKRTYRKENAYVFDFDPARTLDIIETIANDQYKETAGGKGDSDGRKQHVRELLNFFPVIGEDDDGEMIELDAEKVLSIPRHIHAKEVVDHGFMSNFLFQNISGIFSAADPLNQILTKMNPVTKKEAEMLVRHDDAEELGLNENGEADMPLEQVIGLSKEKFGDPVFGDVVDLFSEQVQDKITNSEPSEMDNTINALAVAFKVNVTDSIVSEAKESYGKDMTTSQKRDLERKLTATADRKFKHDVADYKIDATKLTSDYQEDLKKVQSVEEKNVITAKYNEGMKSLKDNLVAALSNTQELVTKATETTVKAVEDSKTERKKKAIEDKVRDHLRGFTRTIPSFLMAYGTPETTLENFEQSIPPEVFKAVTSITVEEFRFLRDGGDYEEDGVTKHYAGHLFDSVVFNDSIKEFMKLRSDLANYFDENIRKDIFDYIPPQKTNQIYTPKKVVRQMVDMLEKENPGCFDDPDKTFADLYMKSGLFITEIVKRLYRSEKMKKLFPDDRKRLEHIMEKQVYGAAPTEIIYMIAMHFIFGYDNIINGLTAEELQELFPNFKLKDTAELAKAGTLAKWVDETFKVKEV